jgi:hypothetical protein
MIFLKTSGGQTFCTKMFREGQGFRSKIGGVKHFAQKNGGQGLC